MPKNTRNETMNRVWIELEKPTSAAHAQLVCHLANNMLKRLSDGDKNGGRFHWSERESRYCYGSGMGYVSLKDSGEWFNLDYFGRADKPAVSASGLPLDGSGAVIG